MSPASPEQLGENLGFQQFKDFRVAKEAGHVDEDVAVQRLHFIGILVKEPRIILQTFYLLEGHAARDATVQGVCLVVAEVDLASLAQQLHNLLYVGVASGVFGMDT